MDIEQIPDKPYDDSTEHPTPEQLFVREAVKCLTPIQRIVWEYHNYEKLTQDEIAAKTGKSRTTVQTQIAQCEARIEKWCQNHIWVYDMLKEQMEKDNGR